jgi:hypothetical protein
VLLYCCESVRLVFGVMMSLIISVQIAETIQFLAG